jgi:hypothetical protein
MEEKVKTVDRILELERKVEELEKERDSIRKRTIYECQDTLMGQMSRMFYDNNYPVNAVPHATILMLDKLMKVTSPKE